MKKFILGLMAVIGLGTVVSSCNDNDDDPPFVTQQTVGGTQAIMQTPNGETKIVQNISFKLTWNYTDKKADIDITGLTDENGSFYPTLKFSDVSFELDPNSGEKEINAINLSPSTNNGFGAVRFASFKLMLTDRIILQSYAPGFFVHIVTENGTSYVCFPGRQAWLGDATAKSDGGDEIESTYCVAIIEPDLEKKQAALYFNNLSLNSTALSYSFTMTNLNCTFEADGKFSAEKKESWSQSVQGPVSEVTFSNLKIEGSFDGSIKIEFDMKAEDVTSHVTYEANIYTSAQE